MHGNPKFSTFFFFLTGIDLKTQKDGYEVKFKIYIKLIKISLSSCTEG